LQWDYIVLSFPAGLLLGVFFFGGLWWTVQKLSTVRSPTILVFVSFLVRTAVVMLGFYVLLMQGLPHLFIALGGYLVARMWCVYRLKPQERTMIRQESKPKG
jgi:F1F0 ATPase subunit 2